MSVSNEDTATSHVVCCAATNSWSGKGTEAETVSGIYSPQQLYHLHDRPASSAIPVRATAARLTYRPTVLDCQPVGRACERRSFDCAVSELCKSCSVAGRLDVWLPLHSLLFSYYKNQMRQNFMSYRFLKLSLILIFCNIRVLYQYLLNCSVLNQKTHDGNMKWSVLR